MGASILRAGIRLWNPGTVNPVAAVKVVRHNLYRPTSLFHETGHQVAHLTGWVPSLRTRLVRALADDVHLQRMWLPWRRRSLPMCTPSCSPAMLGGSAVRRGRR